MGTTVDSLEIQLQAQAGKANNAIDTLITKLGTLNTSLTKINGSGLSGVANGVDKLSRCIIFFYTFCESKCISGIF